MVSIERPEMCTGCTACSSVCPNDCIEMTADDEGFKYPKVNKIMCNDCQLCESVCSVEKLNQLDKKQTIIYAVQSKDDNARQISSAGGFFRVVSEYVLDLNGVVFGAGFDDELMVCHDSVQSMVELANSSLCGSKYVQSDLGNCFRKVKKNLLSGRMVSFSGLPCQVAGLKTFLGKDYDNLILIDLTCYGAPSPKLYKMYLEYCAYKYNSRVAKVNFRDKSYGYSSPNMRLELENGLVKEQNSTVKSFIRTFFSGISSRPSCYNCAFKTVERVSDFTLGDCKNIGRFHKDLDDDIGTTVVYVHSIKGREVISRMKNHMLVKTMDIEDVLNTCGKKMIESDIENPLRKEFFADIDKLSYEKLIKKYVPESKHEKIANIVKPLMYRMGFVKYGVLKKLMTLKK